MTGRAATAVDSLVRAGLRAVRPAAAERVGSVPASALLGWYSRTAVGPVLGGALRRPVLGSARGLVMVGGGTRLLYPGRLHLGRHCAIGARSLINAFSQQGVHLGDGVTIREGAWIQCASSPGDPGVGLVVGARTYIGPGAVIGVGGRIVIGADCQIGAGVTLVSENHAVSPSGAPDATAVVRQGIAIGDGCWLGHRVTVVDGVEIGERCVVGAGAVVTRSWPAGTRLVGVPARPVGEA